MRSAEEILEDILDKMNTGSGGGMNGASMDDLIRALRENTNSNRDQTKTFKSSAKQAGSDALGILGAESVKASDGVHALGNSTANVVDSMFANFKILKSFPILGDAISGTIRSMVSFYDFLDSNLSIYKAYNTSGLQVQGGMMSLYAQLSKTYLSFGEFQAAIQDAKSAFNSLGPTGVKQLGSWMTALKDAENASTLLGAADEQLATYVVQNIKAQKASGIFNQMTEIEKRQSNQKYIQDLMNYSKVLGMSTDELSNKLSASVDDYSAMNYKMNLLARGFNEKDAAAAADGYRLVNSSLGKIGKDLESQAQNFADFGYIDKDSPLYQLYAASPEFQKVMVKYKQLMNSGALATDEGRKAAMNLFANNKSLLDELTDPKMRIVKQQNTQLAQYMDSVIVELQNATNVVAQGPDWITNSMNSLNNYSQKVISAMRDFIGRAIENPKKAIVESFSALGAGASTALTGMDKYIQNLSADTKKVLGTIFGPDWEKWIHEKISSWKKSADELSKDPLKFLGDLFAKLRDDFNIVWSKVKETFGDINEIITDTSTILKDIKEAVKNIKETAEIVRHPLDASGKWISDKASDVSTSAQKTMNGLLDKMGNLFSDTDIKQPQSKVQVQAPNVTTVQAPLIRSDRKGALETTLNNVEIIKALQKSNELLDYIGKNIKKEETPRGPFRIN